MRSKPITKEIKVSKYKFKVEIYPSLLVGKYFRTDMKHLYMHLVIKKN